MPVVTSLEVHQRDKDRVKLFLDDEYALDLPLIEAARISPGQTLTDSDLAELAGVASTQCAFDQAVRFLSYRPRSTEEVRRYLIKKNVPDSLVADVLERLRRLDYVDDLAFARFWISNRDRFKPMGLRALRFELRQKGIDDQLIDALLADIDEEEAAYRAAQARISRYRGNTSQSFGRRLRAMLRRRGFGEYVINEVILRITAEIEAQDPAYFVDEVAD